MGNDDKTKKPQSGGILAQRLKALAGSSDGAPPPQEQKIHTMQRRHATPQKLEAGQVLAGHYRIVEKLGAGGMGMVFKVEDLTLDNRLFAIKVLPPELARDEGAVNRLKKEALAAMELHHSHIMTVNAFEGLSETKFLVMEYLDGPNLDVALSEKERFSVEEIIEVGKQVCSALDFAHSRNVIHRDIKPANLVYKMEAGKQVVKIADFGIAYQIRESQAKITGEVSAAGTLFYMAPEQFLGKRPTARSDQYSLAVSFYEMLAGAPPITGTTIEMIIELVKTVKPDPIDGLDEHVNKALLRAMDKNPELRFESCMAFCAALEGEQVAPSVSYRSKPVEGVNAASREQQDKIRQFLSSNLFDDEADEEEERRRQAEEEAARKAAEEAARAAEATRVQAGATLAPVVVPPVPKETPVPQSVAQRAPVSAVPSAPASVQQPQQASVQQPQQAPVQQLQQAPVQQHTVQELKVTPVAPMTPVAPVAPVKMRAAPTTPPPPQHRRPRVSAPQAFQQAEQKSEQNVALKSDYNEERLAEIDSMVTNARTALRDTIIMGVGFIVIVVLLVMVAF